jgi:hypothetical protein
MPVELGDITVSVSVIVVFALADRGAGRRRGAARSRDAPGPEE